MVTAGSVGSGEPISVARSYKSIFQKQRTPASSIAPKSCSPWGSLSSVKTSKLRTFCEERATLIDRHGFDARSDQDHAADEGAAEGVVEGADAFGWGHGCAGHGLVS